MKYKIWDKVNNIYLDLTNYCVNGYGDVMTTEGLVLMNQDDFEVQMDVYVILEQNQFTDYEFCGVFATREKAQTRLNEIVEELPRQKDSLYIEEHEI